LNGNEHDRVALILNKRTANVPNDDDGDNSNDDDDADDDIVCPDFWKK